LSLRGVETGTRVGIDALVLRFRTLSCELDAVGVLERSGAWHRFLAEFFIFKGLIILLNDYKNTKLYSSILWKIALMI
jgi:hypothetical protein